MIGQLTPQNVGRVARTTLDHALRGKTIVVPGFLNQVMRWMGGLIPPALLSRMLGKHWRAARKNRGDLIGVEDMVDREKTISNPSLPQVFSLTEVV
ncbi:MAG: hypothetical protein MUO54_07175 [Anaerolineales bacterium]|nr:hypothetical protein [Anaerolineales bacterium]